MHLYMHTCIHAVDHGCYYFAAAVDHGCYYFVALMQACMQALIPADPTPSTPFTDFHRKSIDRIYQVCGILRGQATMDRMNSKMHNLNMSTAFWNDFKMLDETSSPYSARLGSARVHSSHDNRTRYALLLLTVSQYISANTWVFHELLYITVATLILTEMMRYTEVAWPLT